MNNLLGSEIYILINFLVLLVNTVLMRILAGHPLPSAIQLMSVQRLGLIETKYYVVVETLTQHGKDNCRLDYCNSLLYNIASKDMANLQRVKNCLVKVVRRSPRFSHSVPLMNITPLASSSISRHFETLHHCLSNSFFRRTFVSSFDAFSSTQAQRTPSIWFSLAICS